MNRFAIAVAGALCMLAVVRPAEATLSKCAAAKKLCVAKKAAALLLCHSKNERPPGLDAAKFTACVQKARDRFDGGSDPSKGCFAKLEAKRGADCLTDNDTANLEATVDAFVDDVVCQLDAAGGTCPAATPTPTPAPTATPTPTPEPTPTPVPPTPTPVPPTPTPVPPTCSDGIKNGGETDIDCGGPTCPACTLGETCGAGSDCSATETCSASKCACAAGRANCDANAADGCEVNTSTDVANCGSCGHSCSGSNGTPSCTAGQCGIACNAGFGNCDFNAGNGCETNLNSVANCGSCGNICSGHNATPICSVGRCQEMCFTGFGDCDNNPINGCETSLSSNNANCGACGFQCAPGKSCVSGTCS